MAHEVSRLESFAGAENIVQIKGSCLEKMPEENFWKLYIQMEYLEDFTEYLGKNYMEKNFTHMFRKGKKQWGKFDGQRILYN